MERLEIPLKKRIERIDRGPALLDIDDVIDLKKVFDCLAAYEDTGLEPAAVEQIKLSFMGKSIAKITEFEGIPIARLKELAEAEKDGRLVVLTCKVGDVVYQVDYMTHSEALKSGVPQCKDPWQNRKYGRKRAKYLPLIVREKKMVKTLYPKIGKTVFLTREEAEAELKKREEAENEAD